MDKLLVTIIALFLVVGGYCLIWQNIKTQSEPIKTAAIASFEECVAAGNMIMESYPRQCGTPDGKHFAENIGNANELSDLIVVDSPRPNSVVKSPLAITGKARGTWYFEASFPVQVVNANNNVLGQIPAQAQGDWMTEDFVPFTAQLEFATPTTATGNLILKNDNPSGLPANDKQLVIPVKF
ncbi:MAG: Gmad2 immunoglobulin-like domain-containing protein [Minisyncoccales bacterium]